MLFITENLLLVTERFKNQSIIIYLMTSLEEHKNNFQQFFEDIKEKIKSELLLDRQKIIGFSASEC